MRRAGFTLIEILVASAIGVLLIALVSGSLMGVKRVAEHNKVLMGLHEETSVIDRRLRTDISVAAPCAKWEVKADPGGDGAWGTGDEIISMTWMTTLSDPERTGFGFAQSARQDLAWRRLQWEGGGSGGRPRLQYAGNSGLWFTQPPGTNYLRIQNDPLPRRDRRRDLEDNDLRYLPGITPVDYASLAMAGDESDLVSNLAPLNSYNVDIRDFRLSWIDRGGWEIVVSPEAGVSQHDTTGGTVPWPSSPVAATIWQNDRSYGVDGVFLDARDHTAPYATRSVADMRPALLRVSFLVKEYIDGPSHRSAASLRIDLSIPIGQELPLP